MRVSAPTNNQSSEIKSTRGSQQAASAQAAKKKPGEASESKAVDTSGSVNAQISSKARDAAKVKDVAANAPDVREEKIAELKRRIADGKYGVNAEAVADRMVDDHLRTGIG